MNGRAAAFSSVLSAFSAPLRFIALRVRSVSSVALW